MNKRPESFVVPFELMNRLYNTLMYYANRTTYEAPRIGGVLAGCPRGEKPNPEHLTFGARAMIAQIDRELLPNNKPNDYWPLSKDERNEMDALRSVVREIVGFYPQRKMMLKAVKRAKLLLAQSECAPILGGERE